MLYKALPMHPNQMPLINPHKRFVLITNSKCGGTTLKSWFLETLEMQKTMEGRFSVLRYYGPKFFFYWRRKSKGLRALIKDGPATNNDALRLFITAYRNRYCRHHLSLLGNSKFLRFAVVRDPYERVVSAYLDKLCGEALDHSYVAEVTDIAGSKPGEISFDEFLDYLLTTAPDEMDRHWAPQSRLLDQLEIDRLVPLEKLESGLSDIEKSLGLKVNRKALFARQTTPHSPGSDSKMDKRNAYISNRTLLRDRTTIGMLPPKHTFLLDQAIRRKIETIYKRDFEILPYPIRT